MAAAGSPAPPDPPLPANFMALRPIFEADDSMLGRLVNIIGVVKDCQLPFKTQGIGTFTAWHA